MTNSESPVSTAHHPVREGRKAQPITLPWWLFGALVFLCMAFGIPSQWYLEHLSCSRPVGAGVALGLDFAFPFAYGPLLILWGISLAASDHVPESIRKWIFVAPIAAVAAMVFDEIENLLLLSSLVNDPNHWFLNPHNLMTIPKFVAFGISCLVCIVATISWRLNK